MPEEYRARYSKKVKLALESRVLLADVTCFMNPSDEAANDRLRNKLSLMLSEGDELWWFSTPFENLSGMAGYACVRDKEVVDYHVVVRS